MKKAWLFLDFDNTLMGTEQYALPSLIERFNALYGKEIDHFLTLDEFKCHFHGQAREMLCENLSHHFNIPVDYATLYDRREWRIMEHYQQIPEGIPMAPGLIEMLSSLSGSYQFALVSNNPIQRAFAAMRFAHNQEGHLLARLFETHFFEAGNVQKPHPDVYLNAMQQVKADPKLSFAVEDSVTGAKAAIAAGLTTFGYTGFSDEPDAAKTKLLEIGCAATFHDWNNFPTHQSPLLSAQNTRECLY